MCVHLNLISRLKFFLNIIIGSSQEEAGIEAPLEHAGTFLFRIDNVQWAFQIEIYRADTYTGVPTE
jgi:hypothetical protein